MRCVPVREKEGEEEEEGTGVLPRGSFVLRFLSLLQVGILGEVSGNGFGRIYQFSR